MDNMNRILNEGEEELRQIAEDFHRQLMTDGLIEPGPAPSMAIVVPETVEGRNNHHVGQGEHEHGNDQDLDAAAVQPLGIASAIPNQDSAQDASGVILQSMNSVSRSAINANISMGLADLLTSEGGVIPFGQEGGDNRLVLRDTFAGSTDPVQNMILSLADMFLTLEEFLILIRNPNPPHVRSDEGAGPSGDFPPAGEN